MKRLLRIGLIASLVTFVLVSVSLAGVRITNIAVSPRVLLEIYKAWQENRTDVLEHSSLAASIFYISVVSDKEADNFKFRFEIKDEDTDVASVDFQTTVSLKTGKNVFNAHQITTDNSQVQFNNNYITSSDLSRMLQGESVIRGNFRLLLVPTSPSGPAYSIRYALFAPPSSQNSPPILIHPRNIAVNTLLPMFSWSPGQGAVSYEVLVSPNQDPTVNTYWRSEKIKVNQLLYSPAARTLENGKKYYWMVIAYDEFGRPIGGLNGRSQPSWFKINSAARVNTAVSPAEADAVLRIAIQQKAIFADLKDYQPIALETTSPDLADLLRQLREGSAKVTAFDME